MTAARERLVRVVAEALEGHQPVGYDLDECLCGDMFVAYEDRTTHQAEAVVAAMEATLGLRVERSFDESLLPKGDEVTDALIRNSIEAVRAKWPNFGMADRLVTNWVSDEGDGK